jgi:hypothetical protein
MEVDTAQQLYDPVAVLTRYVNQRNKPTTREQKEKHTPEGLNTLSSKLNTARPLQQKDADTTKENINGITNKFQWYVPARARKTPTRANTSQVLQIRKARRMEGRGAEVSQRDHNDISSLHL